MEIEYVEQIGLKRDTLYRYMNCKLHKMDKRKVEYLQIKKVRHGVQCILRSAFVLCFMYHMLPVSLDYPFLIARSVFSNVYLRAVMYICMLGLRFLSLLLQCFIRV